MSVTKRLALVVAVSLSFVPFLPLQAASGAGQLHRWTGDVSSAAHAVLRPNALHARGRLGIPGFRDAPLHTLHHASPTPLSAASALTPCVWTTAPFILADTHAHYWSTLLVAYPGITLTITGAYPAARYVSLQVYSVMGGSLGSLADKDFPPDAGATNPFLGIGTRGALTDTYTLHVSFGPTSISAPGTLGVDVPGGTPIILTYRIFLPDRTANAMGNVPLPTVTARWSTTGAPLACPQVRTSIRPPTAAATRPLHRANGAQVPQAPHAATPGGARAAAALPAFLHMSGQQLGGYANDDAAYLVAALSPTTNLYVVRFKAPTSPLTLDGQQLDSTTQLRYWSLCSYFYSGQPSTCLADEQVVHDANGDVTLVLGPWWARPANATAANGITWVSLNWFTKPYYVILRQLLPAVGFTQSAFAVPVGRLADSATMGLYAPLAAVCSTAQFVLNECSS